jgi:outer membrane lipoprotein-sorting protein
MVGRCCRRWWVAAGAAMAFWAARGAAAEDARQILLRSLAPRAAAYSGEQVTEVTGPLGVARQVRQQVYRAGNVLRIEFPAGQILFDDGTEQRFYLPRLNEVRRSPSRTGPQAVQHLRRQLLGPRAVCALLPDESIAGRPAWVVRVSDAEGGPRSRTLWIDRATFVRLGLSETGRGGRPVKTYFTRIAFGPPPAEKLSFTPPSGAKSIDPPMPPPQAARLARAWGGLLVVKPPAGYRLRGFFPHSFRGQRGLVAVYDGPRSGDTLSLFQGPAQGMGPMVESRPEGLQILSSKRGDADVTLVGPLPQAALEAAMATVAPAPSPPFARRKGQAPAARPLGRLRRDAP